MKKLVSIFTLLFALSLLFNGCEKIDPPTITLHELGYENSKTVKQGSDLHVEAEILAEGKIQTIRVEIHPEEHGVNSSWTVNQVFTKFEGYKNTEFHEHFEATADALTGAYHFRIEVVDQEGNVGYFETEIEVLE